MKILVPISDDAASREAIPQAVTAAGAGGHIVLASIGELPEVSEQAEEARAALRERLDKAAREISGPQVTERIELAGDPVRGIIEIARDEHVDRIVIASTHRGQFEQLVDGSIAEELREDLKQIPVDIVSAG
ncbi:MAG: universal stress protein [Dehalococcoidia bacterium]|nr:universal stress protein [Dehalococcoidia bacterium]MCA9849312.1 universal stress protein [Dehalococcoidia bacterium]MCB9490593.1 universal stress protein [Dehalococcoidia bacterium]